MLVFGASKGKPSRSQLESLDKVGLTDRIGTDEYTEASHPFDGKPLIVTEVPQVDISYLQPHMGYTRIGMIT
jgi:hypothetical protein